MYALGDIHGKFGDIIKFFDEFDIHDINIAQVGDIGIGFNFDDLARFGKFNNELKYRNIHLYAIRGNHDDPRYFLGKYLNYFSNLHLVPDYSVIEIEGRNILFIGGAISIDRLRMKREMEKEVAAGQLPIYFENEKFVLDKEKLEDIKNVDILITHSAPNYCFPYSKDIYDILDTELPYELRQERAELTELVDILLVNNNIYKHCYGHFHKSNLSEDRGIEHICLDINELKEIR